MADAEGIEIDMAGDWPTFLETPQVIASDKPSGPLGFFMSLALATGAPVVEEFRGLAARVKSLGEERPLRCIGLVSALGGEGKTTMALGLASALALAPGRRVLLIEADLRRPTVAGYLSVPRVSGLAEWLESSEKSVHIRQLVPLGFSLLQTGRIPAKRPETLASERMARLIQSARACCDFVVVDCPPLVPVADAVMIQDMLDGFLLVVRARKSPREAIVRAASALKPDRIRGIILNDHRELLPSYYRYAYPHYGQSR